MESKIICSLTPKFIEPLSAKKTVWKPKKFSGEFFENFQKSKIKNLIKKVEFPSDIKDVLKRLDSLSTINNELLIDCKLNKVLIFSILCHKNSKYIKKINFSKLKKNNIEKIKDKYKLNIKNFDTLFKTNIPQEIFQLYGFYQSFQELVDNKSLRNDSMLGVDVWLRGFENIQGIFKSVFSENREVEQNDILSLRHGNHPLSYFPVFEYGSDGVSHGFVFDLQLNTFTTCAFFGDGKYHAVHGLWSTILNVVINEEDIEESIFEQFEDENFDLFERGDLFLDYNKISKVLVYADILWLWIFNFLIIEYLNINEIKILEMTRKTKARYLTTEDLKFHELVKEIEIISHNQEYTCFPCVYPRIVILIRENFNQFIDFDIICSFIDISQGLAEGYNLNNILNSGHPVLNVLDLDKSMKKGKIKIVDRNMINKFIKILINFAEKETSQKRYGLSLLLGLLFWDQTKKKASEYSVKLLSKLPDDVCHPLVKELAIEHEKTRFNSTIHI